MLMPHSEGADQPDCPNVKEGQCCWVIETDLFVEVEEAVGFGRDGSSCEEVKEEERQDKDDHIYPKHSHHAENDHGVVALEVVPHPCQQVHSHLHLAHSEQPHRQEH